MSYLDKSKTRDPKDTINILKSFFENRGFKLNVAETKSTIGTYSYTAMLLYNGYYIANSNGKGMSADFGLASCLAELYERFCQKMPIIHTELFRKKLQSVNRNEYGFNLYPDESEEDVMYSLNSAPALKKWFSGISEEHIRLLLNALLGESSICLPYNKINSKDSCLIDPLIATTINNATGMAAGNTFEEAFNQGYSEILERFVTNKFLKNEYTEYHIIKNNHIQNDELRSIINKIENEGHKLYIIDFSYTEGLPVIGLIIVDNVNKRFHTIFGSFPIFDIALERCLTEMWQNKIDIFSSDGGTIVPYRLFTKKEISDNFTRSLDTLTNVPDDFFKNLIFEDSFRNECYLPETSSVSEIFNFYVKLDKAKEFNSVYRDYSIINEVRSIHIIPTNLLIADNRLIDYDENILDWDYIQYSFDIVKALQEELISSKPNLIRIKESIFNLHAFNRESKLIDAIYYRDPTSLLNEKSMFSSDLSELDLVLYPPLSLLENALYEFKNHDSLYFKESKKFELINAFKDSSYSKEEILSILSMFNISFSDEDYINSKNKDYVFKKIFVDSTSEHYSSTEYYNLMKTWSNNYAI